MRTYPITDSTNTMFATEIENAYVSPSTVAKILREIKGVSSVTMRKAFSSSSDTHVKFLYRERPFVVVEPYGDSSRYWIGPENDKGEHIEIKAIDSAFNQYVVPPFAKFAGDLVSLRVLTAFRR